MDFVLTKQHNYVTNWIWELIDFIINQHNLGYELMPLGSKFETVFEILFKNLEPKMDIKSHMLLLLFEFLILYNMQDAYEIFRGILNPRIVFCELVAPMDESKIYERDIALSFTETKIKEPLEITWSLFKKSHANRILHLHKNRKYTPITHNRPFVLILLGNIYRDRYFPEIWRSKYL